MELKTRKASYSIPRYSLTGDILSYQRCSRQYRYYNGSSLPPSRPVQFWTGEFVHKCLEDAYTIWIEHSNESAYGFPWPMTVTPYPPQNNPVPRVENDIGLIGDRVEARLSAMQKNPRSGIARQAAYNRVNAAINILGPHLFPLITSVEQKISGSRDLLKRVDRTDKYELFGIADVISHVEYQGNPNNRIIELLAQNVNNLEGIFDVIVDYKASRRPNISEETAEHHKWQVQTYSWLRGQVATNIPIRAGIIVYINELYPTKSDLYELKREVEHGIGEVLPPRGSADYYALFRWNGTENLPKFTDEFLLKRALRFISTAPQETALAVHKIDTVVQEIEVCVQSEYNTGSILSNWTPRNSNEQDCVACDFRRFCSPEGHEPWSVQAPG